MSTKIIKMSEFSVIKGDNIDNELYTKLLELFQLHSSKVVCAIKEKLYEVLGCHFETDEELLNFIEGRVRLISTTGSPHIINVCLDYVDDKNWGDILFRFSNEITIGRNGNDFVNNNYTISIG